MQVFHWKFIKKHLKVQSKKDFSRKHPNVVNYQIMKIRSYVDINNNPYRENK